LHVFQRKSQDAWISAQNKLPYALKYRQIRTFTDWEPFQKRLLCGLKDHKCKLWIAQKAQQNKHAHEVASKWAEKSSK